MVLVSIIFACCIATADLCNAAEAPADSRKSGKELYDFYCYQCHAYSGTAETLAATYMDPKPRNFTQASALLLNRERMIDAVKYGRDGTAMAAFANVLSQYDIEQVVDFVRDELMTSGATGSRRYHTAENGWINHNRFSAAFPFATGEISLDVRWQELTESQRHGRTLYLNACVSCHDHGGRNAEGFTWELRPLSYPRAHYSHMSGHLISGASPYAVHDQPPSHPALTPAQKRGQNLFDSNCAFCHARDGTGKNWIGSFMQPHPRDLTSTRFARMDPTVLMSVVRDGLAGTSMPAWRDVLNDAEIRDIAVYISEVLGGSGKTENGQAAEPVAPNRLAWRRVPRHAGGSLRFTGAR